MSLHQNPRDAVKQKQAEIAAKRAAEKAAAEAQRAQAQGQAKQSKASETFATKPFSVEWALVFKAAQVLTILAIAVSVLGTSLLFAYMAKERGLPLYWLIGTLIGAAVGITLETITKKALDISVKEYLQNDEYVLPLCIAMFTIVVGSGLSITGGYYAPELLSDGTANPLAVNETYNRDKAALVAADAEIARLTAQKTKADWVRDNRTLPKLRENRNKLAASLTATENSTNLDSKFQKTEKSEQLRAWSLGSEMIARVVLIACLCFSLYYLYQTYLEGLVAQSEPQQAQQQQTTTPVQQNVQNFPPTPPPAGTAAQPTKQNTFFRQPQSLASASVRQRQQPSETELNWYAEWKVAYTSFDKLRDQTTATALAHKAKADEAAAKLAEVGYTIGRNEKNAFVLIPIE